MTNGSLWNVLWVRSLPILIQSAGQPAGSEGGSRDTWWVKAGTYWGKGRV